MTKAALPAGLARCYMGGQSREGLAQMTLSGAQWTSLTTALQLENITSIPGSSLAAPATNAAPRPPNPRADETAINRMNSLWSQLLPAAAGPFPNIGRLQVYKKSAVPLQSGSRFDQFYVFYDPVTGMCVIYVSYAYG